MQASNFEAGVGRLVGCSVVSFRTPDPVGAKGLEPLACWL